MVLPVWSEVCESLTDAIRAALPLQIREAGVGRVSGIGLHIDTYYGCAGLYLLPESAVHTIDPEWVDNIGDWPISTDWDRTKDHARAFAAHWGRWDNWFRDHLNYHTEAEGDEIGRELLRGACEAMRQNEAIGLLNSFPKAEDFKIIIADHDDPRDMYLERYDLFVRTGEIRCWGVDD